LREHSAIKIFSKIKKKSDSKFKDSLINVLYLQKSFAIGELAEKIIVENINKRICGLTAVHIGQKTKNEYDPKTDIVIKNSKHEAPFSVKTGTGRRLKIKNGISSELIDKLNDEHFDKKEMLYEIKKELSANLFILHLNAYKGFFYLYLKKINLINFDSIKMSKKNIILRNKDKKTLIFFDLERLAIYANNRCLDTIDHIELGKDNSEDKKLKGESLLINSIIMEACACDIPILRKIESFVKKESQTIDSLRKKN